jgi:hypothetical protein
MNEDTTSKRFAALLHGLDLPTPFTIPQFCDLLAASRGRPIRLVPSPLPVGQQICGAFAETDDEDWIFYTVGTSPFHQAHVILHEVGHLLLGHHGEELVPASLVPDLDLSTVRRLLGRSSYQAEDEREAETFATMVWRRVRDTHPVSDLLSASPAVPAELQPILARFQDILAPSRTSE